MKRILSLAILLLLPTLAFGSQVLTPPHFQELDASGDVYNGGKIETFECGTTTQKTTYTAATLSVSNTNPVILDSAGRSTPIHFNGCIKYTFKNSSDTLIYTRDNVYGEGGSYANFSLLSDYTGSASIGTHTGSDDAATLTDSSASWVADELIGQTVSNSTDGSSCTITDNTTTTVTCTLAGGTGNDWDTSDSYSITNTGRLVSAIAAIGSTEQDLYLDVDDTLAASDTIPATLKIICIKGDVITIAASQTLTVTGTLECGPTQVFDASASSAAVSFGAAAIQEALPEWWGIDGTADEVQINKAIDSMTRGIVKLLAKEYVLAAAVVMAPNITLEGVDGARNYGIESAGSGELDTAYRTRLYQGTTAADAVTVDGNALGSIFYGAAIKNLDIKGNSGTADGVALIGGNTAASPPESVIGGTMENVNIWGFDGSGGNGIRIDGNVFRWGFFNVTCHDNTVNLNAGLSLTYTANPSQMNFYNCTFSGSQDAETGSEISHQYNVYLDKGSQWGFWGCDFSRTRDGSDTGITVFVGAQSTFSNCNFEHGETALQADTQFICTGCSFADNNLVNFDLDAGSQNSVLLNTRFGTLPSGEYFNIAAGVTDVLLHFATDPAGAPITTNFTDSSGKATFLNNLLVDDDGALGNASNRVPDIHTTNSTTYGVATFNSENIYSLTNGGVDDATPSVDGVTTLVLRCTGGALNVTDFDDGAEGQVIRLLFQDANCTVVDGGNIASAGNFNGGTTDTMTFIYHGTTWKELARSNN